MFARKNTLSLLKPDASNAGSTPPMERMKRDSTRVSLRNSPSDAPSTLPNASATRNVSSCLSEYAPMTPRTCTSVSESLSGMIFGSEVAIDLQIIRCHHPGREAALECAPDLRAIDPLFRGNAPDEGEVIVWPCIEAHEIDGHSMLHGRDPARERQWPALRIGNGHQRKGRPAAIYPWQIGEVQASMQRGDRAPGT